MQSLFFFGNGSGHSSNPFLMNLFIFRSSVSLFLVSSHFSSMISYIPSGLIDERGFTMVWKKKLTTPQQWPIYDPLWRSSCLRPRPSRASQPSSLKNRRTRINRPSRLPRCSKLPFGFVCGTCSESFDLTRQQTKLSTLQCLVGFFNSSIEMCRSRLAPGAIPAMVIPAK